MKVKTYVFACGGLVAVLLMLGTSLLTGTWNSGTGKLWTTDRVGIGLSAPTTDLHVKSNRFEAIFANNVRSRGLTSGIFAQVRSRRGDGVFGAGLANRGNNSGVTGLTNSLVQGWGVFSVGDLGASGAKLFRIDHPLNPANRYLHHFSAEGPEPYNLYRGNVFLDVNGEALVTLPDYFEAINRDFQYQLTPVGAPAPHLFVAIEIQDNVFLIAGGEPGMKVSWTVTGVRNDPYMRTYGKPTEQDKLDEDRGSYLHPELYGQPVTRREVGVPIADD